MENKKLKYREPVNKEPESGISEMSETGSGRPGNKAECLKLMIRRIDRALEEGGGPVLVAIDGKSGSGKSTLGCSLAERYGANLYHMDDFFLQPAQRTEKRLLEIGGNVDYERFREEVLEQIGSGQSFSYGIFDCGQQRIARSCQAEPNRLHIVEGSYSTHPYFASCYDVTVCLDISGEEQRERIRIRNGEAMLKRFEEEWIPRENAYLAHFGIREKSDFWVWMGDLR